MGRADDTDDRARAGKGILHPEGMRAARDLAVGVVHEVNNVLGVIIGNAHLATKNMADSRAVERYLGEVRGAADEGRELMRELSMLGGEESGRVRPVSLNDLAHQLASESPTPVDLVVAATDVTVGLNVWLGQDALGSVVSFMAATGSVKEIRIATRILGQAAMLTIEDDGTTPTKDELASLFAPFAKLDRRPKLGLQLTKLAYLAEQSHGHVAAAACEPSGLRIVLTLPLCDESALADGPSVTLPK